MSQPPDILFICQFGGGKSVIATSLFNELADQHGLGLRATAVAADEPFAAVPAPVADFLERESLELEGTNFVPRRVSARDATTADRIIAIGCDVSSAGLDPDEVERWDDVPSPSEDLEGSAAAIRSHVEALIARLRGPS